MLLEIIVKCDWCVQKGITHYILPELIVPNFCSTQLVILIYYVKLLPLGIKMQTTFSIVHSIYTFLMHSVNRLNIMMFILRLLLQIPDGHQD